jgi:hypothetical protein
MICGDGQAEAGAVGVEEAADDPPGRAGQRRGVGGEHDAPVRVIDQHPQGEPAQQRRLPLLRADADNQPAVAGVGGADEFPGQQFERGGSDDRRVEPGS